jgi:hypothetical protein
MIPEFVLVKISTYLSCNDFLAFIGMNEFLNSYPYNYPELCFQFRTKYVDNIKIDQNHNKKIYSMYCNKKICLDCGFKFINGSTSYVCELCVFNIYDDFGLNDDFLSELSCCVL